MDDVRGISDRDAAGKRARGLAVVLTRREPPALLRANAISNL